MRKRIAAMPLFRRVLVTNAFVLALAVALLTFGPVTVSIPVALTELLILLAGMVTMLVFNLLLLRPAFGPLYTLAAAMRRIDPFEPERRGRVVLVSLAVNRGDAGGAG